MPLCGAVALAQAVAPSVRIVRPIEESARVTLKGNTHPLANARNDRGRVSPDLPMTDLILVLSRSPEQQAAFDKFVAGQYDPGSPDFHHWLAPEQVGAEFGPSASDIATISNWLTGHGFTVDKVSKDRMSIRFSGTAGQVESAFHTEIHHLEARGVQHIGNFSDPQIPAALAQVVVGPKSLHNFFARPRSRLGSKVIRDTATGKWRRVSEDSTGSGASGAAKPGKARPEFGISVPASGNTLPYLVEDVTPYDFATIYNILPLWTASTPVDGTGQTIAIAGTSAINFGTSVAGGNGVNDLATFRSTFGLPAYTTGQFTMFSGNSQPLTVCTDTAASALCGINDLLENTLDVEWSGAIAKGANVVLVASYPASSTDDNLFDSESYIVDNKTANIMNVSYGQCELFYGTAGNVENYNLWQTAASEGIAVFVSAGDGGSAECDDGGDTIGNPYSAQYGLSVSGLASTPYNTAVGGTDFNWCSPASTTECTAAPYWSSTNAANGSSALGYVPEVPWNDTCAGPLAVSFLEGQASQYNITGVSDAETACNFVYNQWSTIYQDTGGAPNGVNLSYYVDTVGGGGGASGCIVSSSTSSVNGNCTAGATSTGATTNPDTGAAQGSISLTNNGWPKPSWQTGVAGIPSDGVRDIPDISFFGSDGFLSSSSYLVCVSALDTSNATCSYSPTSEPTAQEVGGTSAATATMSGVMALINQKAGEAQGNPNAEFYSLAAKQTYSNCSAEKATTANVCYFNDIDTYTNAMPCDYGATEGDPSQAGIQSPNCSILNSGDLIGILPSYSAGVGYDQATGLGSLNVANVVNGWANPSTSTFTLTATTPAAVAPGTSASSTVTVATTDGYSGTVTLSCALTSSNPSTATDAPSCSIATPTVTLNSSATSGTANVTITTTAATTSQLIAPHPRGEGQRWMSEGAVLALLMFFGVPIRRRYWRSVLSAVLAIAALSGLTGCGNFWEAPVTSTATGTTAGTYTFTVTGTGNPVVTPVTTTFSITVN